jgi:hypothetical protein
MPPERVRVTCHEVNSPFRKFTNANYRVKWSRMGSNLIVVGFTSMAFLDDSNGILKQ